MGGSKICYIYYCYLLCFLDMFRAPLPKATIRAAELHYLSFYCTNRPKNELETIHQIFDP